MRYVVATGWVVALIQALIIMEQWCLWLMFTSQLWMPWSMVIGMVIAAAQMLALFDRRSVDVC